MKAIVCIPLVRCLLVVVPILAVSSPADSVEIQPAPGVTQAVPSATPTAAAAAPLPPNQPAPVKYALELGAGGLSGIQGGSLGLGFASPRAAFGLNLDFRHSSLEGSNQGDATPELTETAIAAGLWLRWEMARTLDGRVGFFTAMDFQYGVQSVTSKVDTSPTRDEAVASGPIVRMGPGIRFWATPRLAVGYTTQLSIRSTTGPLLAFTQSTSLAPSTYEFENFEIALVGRFTVLALF